MSSLNNDGSKIQQDTKTTKHTGFCIEVTDTVTDARLLCHSLAANGEGLLPIPPVPQDNIPTLDQSLLANLTFQLNSLDASSLVLAGSNVTSWKAGVSATPPYVLGGVPNVAATLVTDEYSKGGFARPVVRFANGEYSPLGGGPIITSSFYTIYFLVGKALPTVNPNYLFRSTGEGSQNTVLVSISTNGAVNGQQRDDPFTGQAFVTLPDGTVVGVEGELELISLTRESDKTLTFRWNNDTTATSSPAVSPDIDWSHAQANSAIGGDFGGRAELVDIAEFLVFDKTHDAAERGLVASYIKEKWPTQLA